MGARGLKLRDFKLKGMISNGSSSNDGQDTNMKSDSSRFSQSTNTMNDGGGPNDSSKAFRRPGVKVNVNLAGNGKLPVEQLNNMLLDSPAVEGGGGQFS